MWKVASEGSNVQLESAEYSTLTINLRRIIDMMHTLVYVLDTTNVRLTESQTYTKPSAKIKLTESFCRNGNCNLQIIGIGRKKMHISVTIFMLD
jgi:hypothetical protein